MPTFNRASKWFRRLVGRGANRDIRPEVLPDGLYADGLNVRPSSISGNDHGIEAIGGELPAYNLNLDNASEWECIGAANVNGSIMSFWCHPEPDENAPLVALDGDVVAQSPEIPYTIDRPLQLAVVENCGNGVVYPADHQSPPLYWSVDELLAGGDTYFEQYTIEVNSVSLAAPPQFPRHINNIDTGNGLPAGQYSYALRYEAPTGDKTNIGPETPLISVALIHDFRWNLTAYPGARTTGREADPVTPTRYSIQLQFRIDNYHGMSFVEVIRRSFIDGQGTTGEGQLQVVGRIPLQPGENRIVTFMDPADANAIIETITPDQEADRVLDILAPKGVEYANSRLHYINFGALSADTGITFTEVDGSAIFPVTKKVTSIKDTIEHNSGYSNPPNNTYLKSYMRGEKYGLAIQPWTGNLSKPFAVPVPGTEEGYQMPNRRDRKTGRSALYSDDPIYAATTDCQSATPVDRTFDAFSQGLMRKSDDTSTVNVIDAAWVNLPYAPLRPLNPDDTEVYGYNISPVSAFATSASTFVPRNGNVFNPRYHALGAAINGVENIPSSVKAFTVVRTPPAGRVICQGIGTYNLTEIFGPDQPIHKSTDSVDFFSRDLSNGIVPQNIVEDMQANPGNYEIQFVSPLGFYSETYGYDAVPYPTQSSPLRVGRGVDMLTYAGIQHDEGQVNAGEPGAGGMGYQSAGGLAPAGNYVGYSAWRQTRPPTGQGGPSPGSTDYSFWNQTDNDGNSALTAASIQRIQEGRGEKWRIKTLGYIYSPGTNSTDSIDFNASATRVFHQPWYVMNIIQRNATLQGGVGEFVNTGTTVMIESCIGISDGAASQSYQLLNERLADVQGWEPTDYRYVWVKPLGQAPQAWLCLTFNAAINPALVLATIADQGFWTAPDGTQVYGLYEVSSVDNLGNYGDGYVDGVTSSVVFGSWSGTPIPVPPASSRILVRYNPLAPVLAFGGDVTTYPSTHAILDRTYARGLSSPTELPINGLPLPYCGFVKSPEYYLPFSSNTLQPVQIVPYAQTLRQWCVVYDGESRTQGMFDLYSESPFTQQQMPRGHYMMGVWDQSQEIAFFNPQYFTDYGAPVTPYMGGLRFFSNEAQFNQDYWKQPLASSVSIPEGTPTPRSQFCSAIAASLERDPSVDSAPGDRTFLSSNVCYLSEENGEGKVISSALGPNGQNMYAWTQSGVVRVLTNKNILTGADGALIATQAISNYWGEQMWLSREIGSPDQMWRLFSKGYAPAGNGQRADSFFWADRNGVYRLTGDTIMDVSRDRYLSQLKNTLQYYPADYSGRSTGFYNQRYNEAWMFIDEQVVPPDPPTIPSPIVFPRRLFVFSAATGEWVGQFSYDFDEFSMRGPDAYGLRDGELYALDRGSTINATTRIASITAPIVGDIGRLKEFTRWAITGTKPDEIEILDSNYNVICRQNEQIPADEGLPNPEDWVLKYAEGWTNWARAINVVDGVISPTDIRPQDEFFYLRCTWKSAGSKEIVALLGSYQSIR